MHSNQDFNLKNLTSKFVSTSFCTILFCCILIAGDIHSANGHIAAFVNSDGKPNINPRQIRGPMGSSVPIYSNPGHFRRQQESGKHWNLVDNPLAIGASATNKEISQTDDDLKSNDGELLDFDDNEKATFVPFIGPRALSNIPEFLKHIRDNLEALQTEEDELDDGYYDYENSLLNPESFKLTNRRHNSEEPFSLGRPSSSEEKPFIDRLASRQRWKPIAAGLDNNHHFRNTQSFVEPQSFQENFMRRSSNNYNPSWSYTKLGLGKRRKR